MSGEHRPPRYELNAACAACLALANHDLASWRYAGRVVRNPGRAAAAVQDIPWPVANIRQQPHRVPVGNPLGMIAGVLDRLEWEHVEIRKNVETWRAKQPELAAALAVLVPGIITQLASREALISEGWLERFEAAYAADEARDNLLDNLATFNAIAAGQVPQ